jgi:hypothetical protein
VSARRILELTDDEVGEALKDFVQKRYPEMWNRDGNLVAVYFKSSVVTATVEWKIATKSEGKAKK